MPPESAEIEKQRLNEAKEQGVPWRKWGPYLSERQWGTVREDYSADGNAWDYFSHDQARSRAYHWGEDGLAGISDEKQRLCFALALWNGKDPILKERLFGLTNNEGNHGEDVKEYYFYLDSTPTHSYMKYLYKYPQNAYPYEDLIRTNRRRSRSESEYELLDTGIFNENRYFDVFVEYAKVTPEDMLVQINICNRGPDAASLHVLPSLWFRNTWSWQRGTKKPQLKALPAGDGMSCVVASHDDLGDRYLYCASKTTLLFTENETNAARIFNKPSPNAYVKDAFDAYVVHGRKDAVNSEQSGTKSAAHYTLTIGAGQTETVRLRLTLDAPEKLINPFAGFDSVLEKRRQEADEFYQSVIPPGIGTESANIMRQALAGMLWSKQYYYFDGDLWLREHDAHPLIPHRSSTRNQSWFHMRNDHIISMPDKWEYPWYAAWDLAFHAIAFSTVDVDFAKEQLNLMLRGTYLHPQGQVPAYEWNFSDVNPPVHAWATLFLHRAEQSLRGEADYDFLKQMFAKLLLNYTWWVNRKDRLGNNAFEGGFLGLDNIGVFDRSAPLPTGGHLEQADGTAWMALFSQNMMELSIELASQHPSYTEYVEKFGDHFVCIASAVNRVGEAGMWDEEDGFYYDVLRFPDGHATRLKVRSMVGLLPLCATTVIEKWQRDRIPELASSIAERLQKMPEILQWIHPTGPDHLGVAERGILALLNPARLRRVLSRMLDENEFLSPYGIRSMSRYHEQHPFFIRIGHQEYRVGYVAGESDSGMFGGNSNWRGPVWMPVNALLIRALINFYLYYGDNFKVECPTGSGKWMNLFEVSQELTNRLTRIFLPDANGRRPVYNGTEKFKNDPHWRNHLLFYEYFHGDNGMGLGASHQTGWTGIIAKLIQLFGSVTAQNVLHTGKAAAFVKRAAAEPVEVGEPRRKVPIG